MPLTALQVQNEKPSEKDRLVLDGNGLYLVVKSSGIKSWYLRYYRPDGRRNMLSLGRFPDVTLAKAREAAEDNRRLLRQGKDPALLRQAARAYVTDDENRFQTVAREWHTMMLHRWKEGSAKGRITWGTLSNHVIPLFGQRPIADISAMEWLNLLKSMERKGIGEQKNRVFSMCRNIYKLAIVTGRAQYNPLANLDVALTPHKAKRMPHIRGNELPELIRDLKTYDGHPVVRAALQLQWLTALRPSELRLAKWDEFNVDKGIWVVPAERMKTNKDHTVPLPTQAINLLNSLKPLNGHFEHVFVVRDDGRPITDSTMSKAYRILGYQGRHVPHGTRHVVATQLKEMGYPGEWIEAQLSHSLPGVTGIYTQAVHMSADQRPAMMQKWADYLDSFTA